VSNRRRFTLNGFTYLEFTTSANHNLRAGNTFSISGIGGVNPEVFNGNWTVHQVTSATVITVNVPVAADIALGTPVIGGTLTPTTSNSLTLHALKSEAEAGTNAVDLTTQGSGSAMVLTKTTSLTQHSYMFVRRVTLCTVHSMVVLKCPQDLVLGTVRLFVRLVSISVTSQVKVFRLLLVSISSHLLILKICQESVIHR